MSKFIKMLETLETLEEAYDTNTVDYASEILIDYRLKPEQKKALNTLIEFYKLNS
jgi:hypothetical protein